MFYRVYRRERGMLFAVSETENEQITEENIINLLSTVSGAIAVAFCDNWRLLSDFFSPPMFGRLQESKRLSTCVLAGEIKAV